MTDIGDDVKTPFKLATKDTMSWNDESDLWVASDATDYVVQSARCSSGQTL